MSPAPVTARAMRILGKSRTGKYRTTAAGTRSTHSGLFLITSTPCRTAGHVERPSTVDRSEHWRSRTADAKLVAAGPASSPVDVGPAFPGRTPPAGLGR